MKFSFFQPDFFSPELANLQPLSLQGIHFFNGAREHGRPECLIPALVFDQFGVGALFDNPALIEHDDGVSVHHRR